jgi:hypothetical protein
MAAIGAVLLVTGAALLNAPAASAAGGNNGTVKVADTDLGGNANDPHLDCTFNIRWFDFDTSPVVAEVSIKQQAPTTDGTMTVTGTTSLVFTPSSATGLDHEEWYTLAFTGTPAAQGFHVKITVDTTSSNGSLVKHKTFWVGPCDESSPSPSESASASESESESSSPSESASASESESESSSSSASTSPTVAGTETSRRPHTTPTVLGTQASAAPTAVDAGLASVPGSPYAGLAVSLMGAGAVLLAGAGWLALARRQRGTHEI